MTTWYDSDKLEKENVRLSDEIKNASALLKRYITGHTISNDGKKCPCDICRLAEAWLQRNR